jgi:iron complex outermembrane receptor protein
MKDLILRGGYTFNHAEDKSPGRVTDKVRNVPERKIDMGASYVIPYIDTRLDLVGIYMGKIYSQLPTPRATTQAIQVVDHYYIANARISKTFLKYFEGYLVVNNILDKNYESEYGFPGPGRNFYLGFSAKY